MKRHKIYAILFVWVFLFGVLPFTQKVLHAEEKDSTKFSIEFDEYTISEALDHLSEITGIEIFTKIPLEDKLVTRSYVNKSVDQIIKGILRNVNHALIWKYNEKDVESIHIEILDQEDGGFPDSNSYPEKKPTKDSFIPKSIAYPKSIRRKQPNVFKKPASRRIVHRPRSPISASEEDTDENEDEKEEKDSVESKPDQDEKPEIESESKSDSEEDKEGSSKDDENEDKK